MHLYDMTGEYQDILDAIEAADGEMSDEQVAALEALGHSIEVKAENVAKVIRSLEADAEGLRQERLRFAQKEQAATNKVARLKGYLLDCLRAAGRDKIKGELLSVAVQQSGESVVVTDEKAIPAAFWRKPEPPPPEVDKKAILAAHKDGQEVPGVAYTRTEYIRIR